MEVASPHKKEWSGEETQMKKNMYYELVDLIFKSTMPARDCDIDSIYRYCVGNRKDNLSKYIADMDYENFYALYRNIEDELKAEDEYWESI